MTAIPLRAPFLGKAGDHLALVEALLGARGALESAVVGDTATIVDRLQRGARPRLIALDLTGAEDATVELAAVRQAAGPGAAILALGLANDVHMFRSLLAAGATDYVPVPSTEEILGAAIDRLLASSETGAAHGAAGQVAVVVGTRGGVGATTTAVTLGWILAHEMSKRTALLDLDPQFGTLALALDIDPGRGLCDALENPERIDGLYIDRATVNVGPNLFALSAEEPIESQPVYDAAAAGILLAELKRKFDWIVVDLPRGAGPLAHTVLAAATHTVIIAETTLAGLRDTIRLQTLARTCNPEQQIIVLKGGALGGGGVSRAEFERELGRPLDAAIPNDQKGAVAAANAGQPLPEAARSSPAAAAMRQIAAKMAGTAVRKPKLSLRFGRA